MSTNTPPLDLIRYTNRKLYSRDIRSYVRYANVYHTICSGRDIRVRCASTGADVTNYVLGEVFTRFCVRHAYVGNVRMHKMIRERGPALDATLVVG